MTIKLSTYICVVLFGSTSWLNTNSVWLELPLLIEKLPEGWSLPSYLTVVVQTASIGPLVYSIMRKFSKISIPIPAIILTLLIFCCSCTTLMALFWSQTVFLFGQERSVILMILLFGMALVNGTSNVLFMPYMATFHASYLTAYFVGMGLSALFPSIVSILQEFNFIMLGWMLLATAAFVYLIYRKNAEFAEKKEPSVNQSSMKLSLTANEPGPTISSEQYIETYTSENKSHADQLRFGLLLFLMAAINAQMNGIVPSVQSYASLPYSQTLAVSEPTPAFSWKVYFLGTYMLALAVDTIAIFKEPMSPTPILQFSTWGSVLIIIIVVCSVALNSFLRTVLATVLGDDATDNETRLFWGGVFIQIGSFLGSIAMFPLVNTFHLFVPAPPCP
ncbi:unnamed protein product [Acanthocheilonema viteae]|uniref:Riboflavin transporter n=1 Tax=Acanthocheilonema viteae TaxID=6277 RepID=A0A498SF61_ACAVI|nr:unnamed protein product [Acanthocheilonema viteae]